MSVDDETAWPLACRLLGRQAPIRASDLGPSDQAALDWLNTLGAIRPAHADLSELLCPGCGEWSVALIQASDGQRKADCPSCGAVPLEAQDLQVWVIQPQWMGHAVAQALGMTHPRLQSLAPGLWRLGFCDEHPVLLCACIDTLIQSPELIEAEISAGMRAPWVFAPDPGVVVRGRLAAHAQWWPLEARFWLQDGQLQGLKPGVAQRVEVTCAPDGSSMKVGERELSVRKGKQRDFVLEMVNAYNNGKPRVNFEWVIARAGYGEGIESLKHLSKDERFRSFFAQGQGDCWIVTDPPAQADDAEPE